MDKDFVDMALEKAQTIESNPSNDESFELCQLIIGLVDVINRLESLQQASSSQPHQVLNQ
jgi:hypothetical protein